MPGITLELDAAGSNIDGTNPGTAHNLSQTDYALLDFQAPEPEQDQLWASSVDTEGERLASTRPRNRTVTIRLRVAKSTNALVEDEILLLGKKVGKFNREGGTLKITTPAGTVGFFDILAGGYGFPWENRLLRIKRGEVTLTLTCAPYIRGAEQDLLDNVETTLPVLVFTEASIPGDVPALGRLVIDEDDADSQWWVTWGVQSRYYDASANAALFFEAEGRTAMGGSATAAGPSGASGGGSNVMRNTALTTTPQAILSTQATGGGAHLSHIGTFRVWARFQAPTSNAGTVSVALEWGEGDFRRFTQNAATALDANWEGTWRLVDLGLVTLTKAAAGTQRWEGRILASSTVGGDDIDCDFLFLVPADEGSGEASGVFTLPSATAFVARDEFEQTAGNLAGKVAPVGGTWAGAGDADDFTIDTTGDTAQRTAVSDAADTGRYAVLGSTNYTNVAITTSMRYTVADTGLVQGVLVRYVDANNWLRLAANPQATGGTFMVVQKRVAGTITTLDSITLPVHPAATLYTLRLYVDAAGRWAAWASNVGGGGQGFRLLATGQDNVLATGGALATGLPGFYDAMHTATASTRNYDDFAVWQPAGDAAMFASQSLEVRHDRVVREDSGGTLWQKPSRYTGDYLCVPASGQESRTARVIVKASRNAPTTGPDSGIDDISARLFVTPRYLALPE